jgi:hypothetical protein
VQPGHQLQRCYTIAVQQAAAAPAHPEPPSWRRPLSIADEIGVLDPLTITGICRQLPIYQPAYCWEATHLTTLHREMIGAPIDLLYQVSSVNTLPSAVAPHDCPSPGR